jgi:hypothetical protein
LPKVPLTRSQDARDLSPQAGRGEEIHWMARFQALASNYFKYKMFCK